MDILKKWFEEAQKHNRTFRDRKKYFIIYKGFKITKNIDSFSLQDVRFKDVYSEVTKKDRKTLNKFGFIIGVDLITYARDLHRVFKYNKRIEHFYELRDKLDKKDPKYSSKLSNCHGNINKSVDLMFYYQTRINQFKIKYDDKNKKVENQARAIESLQKIKQRTKKGIS